MRTYPACWVPERESQDPVLKTVTHEVNCHNTESVQEGGAVLGVPAVWPVSRHRQTRLQKARENGTRNRTAESGHANRNIQGALQERKQKTGKSQRMGIRCCETTPPQ